jgi:hypothetical protein
MNVSTKVRIRFAMALLAVGAAACSDTPTAPTAMATRRPLKLVAPSLAAYYSSFAFTLDPSSPHTLTFGPHKVNFPAYSVCDPATSGYGEGMWDQPCEPLQAPLQITATFTLDEENHARIEFQPSIRFVPAAASDTSHWVTLTLSEPYELEGTDYSIDWLRPATGEWVDEALVDPTMKAWTDPVTNSVTRRIKHFSGYNVTAGFVDVDVDIQASWW